MQHRLTENVKLLQKVSLFYEGTVLLLKRSSAEHSRPGCWDLPGGNSEWPATGQQGDMGTGLHIRDVIREVQEETSIEIKNSELKINNVSYLETHFDEKKQIYSIIFGWHVSLNEKPEVKLSHEHTEYAWVALNEIDNYDFGANGGWIKEVITSKQ